MLCFVLFELIGDGIEMEVSDTCKCFMCICAFLHDGFAFLLIVVFQIIGQCWFD